MLLSLLYPSAGESTHEAGAGAGSQGKPAQQQQPRQESPAPSEAQGGQQAVEGSQTQTPSPPVAAAHMQEAAQPQQKLTKAQKRWAWAYGSLLPVTSWHLRGAAGATAWRPGVSLARLCCFLDSAADMLTGQGLSGWELHTYPNFSQRLDSLLFCLRRATQMRWTKSPLHCSAAGSASRQQLKLPVGKLQPPLSLPHAAMGSSRATATAL